MKTTKSRIISIILILTIVVSYLVLPSYAKSVTNIEIDAIPGRELTVERIKIQQINDSIMFEGEKKTYKIKTKESGTYRFDLSDVPNNIGFSLYLYNSNMEQLEKKSYCANGDGITINLSANSNYYVVVQQYYNTGSYTLNVGTQKETVNIGQNTIINDSIQFINQKNIYKFTSRAAGTYRFDLSNVPNNIGFILYVYNSNMEQLDRKTYCDNGDGITIDLSANNIYYVVVEQCYNTGSYTLNVGIQKETVNIDPNTIINDSIQFIDQKNIYKFTSKVAGTHRFDITNVQKDIYFTLYVFNSYMEQLEKRTYCDNGDGITINLLANSTYYAVVQQCNNTGTYTLSITSPEETHTLSSISIKSKPSKTSYYVGDVLDTSGLTIIATYSDGSSKTFSSGFTCSPTSFNCSGKTKVIVTYEGKTTSFDVTCKEKTNEVVSRTNGENTIDNKTEADRSDVPQKNNTFSGGTDTEKAPYFISTPEQFDEVRNYLDSYLEMISDIDLSSLANIVSRLVHRINRLCELMMAMGIRFNT